MKRRYQIGLCEYLHLLDRQGQVCRVCGTLGGSKRNHGNRFLSVDHAHDTGKVRGLLCQSCNGGMGVLGEDNLEAAVDYLKESVS